MFLYWSPLSRRFSCHLSFRFRLGRRCLLVPYTKKMIHTCRGKAKRKFVGYLCL